MKKVVVIGGTGLLGKPVAEELAANQFKVVVLSRTKSGADPETPNIEYVQGDLKNAEVINRILNDAYGMHINLSGDAESKAAFLINEAKAQKLQLVTYISGHTVNKENAYFEPTKRKHVIENHLASSGLNYAIFKPTWFMESIPLFVSKGRASYFGKQPNSIHFVAAADFAKMVVQAYTNKLKLNESYAVVGPEPVTFQQALLLYTKTKAPAIKNVSSIPYPIGNLIAAISGNKEMKKTIAFMKHFETAKVGHFNHDSVLTGKTSITDWLASSA